MLGLGLGKTVSGLTIGHDSLCLGDANKILIVAPKRVANTVWHEEAKQWHYLTGLRFSNICKSDAKQRDLAARVDADVYTINYDNLVWLIKRYHTKWKWDMVILDESSAFKSHKAKRFLYMSRLCSDVPKKNWKNPIRRMIQLTATPATNGLTGLWSQMFLLDRGRALGGNYTLFERRWFEPENTYSPHSKMVPIDGAKDMIFKRLEHQCLVMRSEDYAVDVKDPIMNTIEVEIPAKHMAEYHRLEREFFLGYEDGDEIVAPNAAALSNKLLQFSNGAVYTGETPDGYVVERDYRVMHDAKIEALQELVSAAEGSQNLLVAYWFKSDLDRIRSAIPGAVVMDADGDCVADWNRGEIPVLLVHPMSAGHGLNLQHGGNSLVLFSLMWSLELYLQLIGRLVRTGQKEVVSVNHLIARGTIDEKVVQALQSNAETQNEMMEYLKTLL